MILGNSSMYYSLKRCSPFIIPNAYSSIGPIINVYSAQCLK